MKSKIPNLFIVGAAKAGTTSLYHYLSQHPEIYMCPIKEPNYFSKDIDPEKIRPDIKERNRLQDVDSFIKSDMKRTLHRAFIQDEDQYRSLFRFAKDQKIIGESSVSYLYSGVAARNIYNFNPSSRIIIILRNPVKRMYSHYMMDRRMAITRLDFEKAIAEDRINPNKSWDSKSLYYEIGEYYEQVKRYYDVFPAENILVLLSDDLRADANATLKEIYKFLRVDTAFQADLNQEFNSGVVPRNFLVSKIISNNYLRIKIRQVITSRAVKLLIKKILFNKPAKESMLKETQQHLLTYYKEDISKLSKLINKDLSKWQNLS